MPSARRRLAHSLRALLPLLLLVALAAPSAVQADSDYEMDLYFRAGYERQVDERTCIAASTAMMLNFIARRDLGLGQRAILRFAQAVFISIGNGRQLIGELRRLRAGWNERIRLRRESPANRTRAGRFRPARVRDDVAAAGEL